MNRAPMTQASYDFGRSLMEIVDLVIRARGFHWPIALAVIDQQGQMLWQTLKTDGAGIIVHYPPCGGCPGPGALSAYLFATKMATKPSEVCGTAILTWHLCTEITSGYETECRLRRDLHSGNTREHPLSGSVCFLTQGSLIHVSCLVTHA